MSFLVEAFIFLLATIVIVPVCRKFGLSSVLGYLLVGLMIGPSVFGFVGNTMEVLHFAEFGIVLLLFLIGLELRPHRLWTMRRFLFGLGITQILITSVVIAVFCFMLLGMSSSASMLIGFSLALSSTAFVVQWLGEHRQFNRPHGRAAFGTLLMQDVDVIPAIAAIGILSSRPGESASLNLLLLAAVAAGFVIAWFTLRSALRFVASTGIHELFTAAALALVTGAALAMHSIGFSMGLGAFIAGVMVADSEYRHQLEADVMPFKGLLVGLFFIAVGMSANLGLLVSKPILIIGLTVVLMVVKSLVIYPLARLQGLKHGEAVRTGLVLSQGGEFAFILFTVGASAQLVDQFVVDIAVLVVTLSIAATPFLVALGSRFAADKDSAEGQLEEEETREFQNSVIIVGFGPFGHTKARILTILKIPFTVIELDSKRVEFVRQFASEVYYGNALNLRVLLSAHIDRAPAIVVAIDDVEASLKIVSQVSNSFPNLKIMARARDRFHEIKLRKQGVTSVIRETLLSSLSLSTQLLEHLGLPKAEAAEIIQAFQEHDAQTLNSQIAIYHDKTGFSEDVFDTTQELKELFTEDKKTTLHIK
ncbi:MAG: monovalent cation:proton antiporter-2 (CPA2) family protein [Candidatus Dadabacteria bacterium]|nr:monovalent cation:proton antiporter-2 (CPA2) family protein [Candidatus Dadabacteria bacterium]